MNREAIEIVADSADVATGTFEYSSGVYIATDGTRTDRTAAYRTLVGIVKRISGNSFVVVPGYSAGVDATLEEGYEYSSSVKVYEVRTAENELSRVSLSEYSQLLTESTGTPSKIMLYTVNNTVQGIVIFK